MFKISTIIVLIVNLVFANQLILDNKLGYITENNIALNKKPLSMGVMSSYSIGNNLYLFNNKYENILTKYTVGNEPYECSIPILFNKDKYVYNTCICQMQLINVKYMKRVYRLSVSHFKAKKISNITDKIFHNSCLKNTKKYQAVYKKNEKKFIIEVENIVCKEFSDNGEESNLIFDLSKCINKKNIELSHLQI